MSRDLLLSADLLDPLANPYATLEEHESAAARLAGLAARGAQVDVRSLGQADVSDLDFLPDHICRWALQEAKRAERETSTEAVLPGETFLDALYDNETDRMVRLFLVDAVLTHPVTEQALSAFDEIRGPVPLSSLPPLWPRSRLIHSTEAPEREGHPAEDLTEFGMLLLQVGTPGALAFLGGTILALRERGRSEHPVVRAVDEFVDSLQGDQEVRVRLGLSRPSRPA